MSDVKDPAEENENKRNIEDAKWEDPDIFCMGYMARHMVGCTV